MKKRFDDDDFAYAEELDRKPRKRLTPLGVAALALALLLAAACVTAYAARGVPLLPEQVQAQLTATPAPTAAPQPLQTDAPGVETPGVDAPGEDVPGTDVPGYVRTAFVVDGEALGVLASREAGESVLAEAIAFFELKILGGGALTTEVENEIAFEENYAGDAPALTADALFALLTGEDSPLSVRSVLTEEVVTYADFETETERDETLLRGTRIILRYGVAGETHTVTTRTFRNGVQQGEAETSTTIAREAINASVREGTAAIDLDAEPGRREGERGREAEGLTFRAPTERGRIESNFGQRAGVLHLGLDYAGEEGDAVLASCGGIVVSAIERGGYGLMVEIDHGEGFVTRYAHLSRIDVAIGDVVLEGQQIGTLGQTGNCAEAHLHFELRIDGIAYNPRYYIG